MIFKEITSDFIVKIVDNKINNKFFKELTNNKQKLMNNLTPQEIGSKLYHHPDKIKQVDKALYSGLKVYEYKIVLDKNEHVRMGFAIDYNNKKIFILALIFLNSKIRKVTFDHAVSNLYYR